MTSTLFISGLFRSGTTFLARALNSHAEMCVLSDPHRVFFKYVRNKFYTSRLGEYNSNQPLDDYFLKDVALRNDFHHSWTSIPFTSDEVEALKPILIKGAAAFSPRIGHNLDKLQAGSAIEVYNQLIQLAAEAYQAKASDLIGTKEVWTDEFLPTLVAQNRKCLQVVRDPRAVIASNRKSATGAYPILFLIRQWRKSVASYHLMEDHPSHLLMKYEDLVSNPRQSFERITNFLGLPFDSNLLSPSTYKDGSGASWQQNSSYGTSKQINSQYLDKWKTILSQDELRMIEWFCLPEMRTMRYNPSIELHSFPRKEDLYIEHYPTEAEWIKEFDFRLNPVVLEEEYKRYQLLKENSNLDEADINLYFLNVRAYNALKNVI
ncbi:sulfotransferase [Phaeodactylibacter xiamenensis]|uniref:sulfotransferase n=1 Tax=Phaeodactylibacter xiamenensis TaxID=1524460 RepID=UPI003BAACC11